MATKHNPRVHPVLHQPTSVLAVIALAQGIRAALLAHSTTFPSPTPSIAQLESHIAALVMAQIAVAARTRGAAQARDAARDTVSADLKALRVYVERVANADPANAAAIVTGASMRVRKARGPTKRNDVDVRNGKLSGSVVATARVGTREKQSHEWQVSTDGGNTFTPLTATTQAKTTLTGLAVGSIVVVRHRAITTAGPTNWCLARPMVVS